jgi:hypothetical protein
MKQMNQALTLEVQRVREETSSKQADMASQSIAVARAAFPDSSRRSLDISDAERDVKSEPNAGGANIGEQSSPRPLPLPRLRHIKTQV